MKNLVPVGFRDLVGPEALRAVERVRHRVYAARIDGLELVHESDNACQFGRQVGRLRGGDFKAREAAKAMDVFGLKHGTKMRFF